MGWYLAQYEADFGRAMWQMRCHFPGLLQSEPFCSWRRMASALLVMEAMCIRFARHMVLEEPEVPYYGGYDDDDGAHLDDMLALEDKISHEEVCLACRKWIEEWTQRKASHMRSLSTSSVVVFADWTEQAGHMATT